MKARDVQRPVKTFAVVRLADVWVVIAQGRRRRRFAYRVDAEEAALRLATEAQSKGDAVEVVVQGRLGELRRMIAVELAAPA